VLDGEHGARLAAGTAIVKRALRAATMQRMAARPARAPVDTPPRRPGAGVSARRAGPAHLTRIKASTRRLRFSGAMLRRLETPMSGQSKYDEHSGLMEMMAETLGIDLTEEMMSGRWTPEDMQAGVERCLGCTDPTQCKGWLKDNNAGADETPGYCRNKELLEAMRARLVSA
jgi:hypothetical protein